MQEQDITLCKCGCELPAPIAPRTDRRKGWKRGEPRPFRKGHNMRIPFESQYVVKDAGYKSPCHMWIGVKRGTPPYLYGGATRFDGSSTQAHIIAYERAVGPVPPGLVLDHLCRNMLCVNAEHLEAVTTVENVRRETHTKLSVEKARVIRESTESRYVLAERYGVHESTIRHVLAGRSWVK